MINSYHINDDDQIDAEESGVNGSLETISKTIDDFLENISKTIYGFLETKPYQRPYMISWLPYQRPCLICSYHINDDDRIGAEESFSCRPWQDHTRNECASSMEPYIILDMVSKNSQPGII